MRYTAIRSEGGLLPYDLLEKMASGEAEGQKPADFGLPKGRRLSDEIQRVWSDAQDLWDIFQRRKDSLPEKDPYGTTLTRERWIVPLLGDPQILAYDLKFQPAAVTLDGLSFPISHFAGEPQDSPPIHIEGCKIDIDRRAPKLRTSPQAIVQEFLNHSEQHLWGIVTNGLSFRLLRDTARTARPSYLEFDLESILQDGLFNEFALFYRLCHRTRLPRPGQPPEDCLLEHYYQLSIEQGGRVRDKLRDGVEEALKILGTGFLRHPQNQNLREALASGRLKPADYHRQLLRLIYRLLFLIVAEERHLIVAAGENAERSQVIYRDCYSISRLRERAEGIVEESEFSDLWLGLKQTFWLLSDSHDSNPLGIPPLNGDLFSSITMPHLEDTQLSNHHPLQAIRRLTLFQEDHVQQRVNYAALDVEELGSVYESLLDFRPVVLEEAEGWEFKLATGSERKTTGSYYTRPELVRELIQSALVPVIEDRLAEAEKQTKGKPEAEVKAAKEKAILNIAVCDPACGSGHFLLEAARRLGRELARIRSGQDEPSPEDFHLAVRDAISHCIYGVDLNPLAVDLCKLALWLEGHWVGKPLSFLDHRIKCGNSLIGVLDSKVLIEGIRDGAFNPVTGDDKAAATALRKRNRWERESHQRRLVFEPQLVEYLYEYAEQLGPEMAFPEDTPADVRLKGELYQRVRQGRHWWHDWTAANLWTAAFFVPLANASDPTIPTYEPFVDFLMEGRDRPQMTGNANALAEHLRFFHWRLEFPEVFEKGGFDVVLGNPPWEQTQVAEKEFFAGRAPAIASAVGTRRKSLIAQLQYDAPALFDDFTAFQRKSQSLNHFIRDSDRFLLSAKGKINTYALFAELNRSLIKIGGRAGFIVPTGIATDDATSAFFRELIQNRHLESLTGFDNTDHVFPAVKSSTRFCLMTLVGRGKAQSPRFSFFLRTTADIRDDTRQFTLTPEDFALLNPNTRTCPVFRTHRDAQLTKAIYSRVPVLVNESDERTGNPWNVKFSQGLFNTTSDSALFMTWPDLQGQGARLQGNIVEGGGTRWLPMYEAKMVAQFDHRALTFSGSTFEPISDQAKVNPSLVAMPRYWVEERYVDAELNRRWPRAWLCGWQDITDVNTMARSVKAAVTPRVAAADTFLLFYCGEPAGIRALCLSAVLNSFVADYVARQKIGGIHLKYPVFKQLAVPPPSAFDVEAPWDRSITIGRWLRSRALELIYTAWDLEPFARDLECSGPPFCWDRERRFLLRCELDAALFHTYGIGRDDVVYIMDTFRIVRRNEENEHGEYRTKRVILEMYDLMRRAIETQHSYQTMLNPPPSDPRAAHETTPVQFGQDVPRGK